MQNRRCEYNKNNIHIVFLLYWGILVAWQNLRTVGNRSGLDTIIKLSLIGMLAIYCLFHVKSIGKKVEYWVLFLLSLLLTFAIEIEYSLSIIVAYVYPVLFIFLTLIIGDNYQIDKRKLVLFFNGIIVIVFYMAAYALIFCRDQFRSAFSIDSAYGHELTSFLISNHEYGLYLIGGITASLLCLRIKQNESYRHKWWYVIALILFIPNLVLTYSRTSMLGMACIFVVYILFSGRNKLKKYMLGCLLVFIVLLICSSSLRSFIFRIVLKGNNPAQRDSLYELAIEYFDSGTIFQKLWGHGIVASRSFFEAETSHGSVHNAYLQVLLYYGVFGLAFLIFFISAQVYASIKLLKKDRFWGVIFLSLLLMCICVMFTNTAYLFNSSIDSYFLTVFVVIIPKYVRNAINNGTFETEEKIVGNRTFEKITTNRATNIA